MEETGQGFAARTDEWSDALADAMRACRRIARSSAFDARTRAMELEINAGLRQLFFSIIAHLGPAFPDWAADDSAGYLRRAVGESVVCVPFHLLPHFPEQTLLAEIESLSQRISLAPNAAICLSGSFTAIKVYHEAADLDFCEYVHEPSRVAAPRIVEVVQKASTDFVCTRLKIGKALTVERAWCRCAQEVEQIALARRSEQWAKVDAIGHGSEIGVLEVTNLVLFADLVDRSAFELSHAAQEALISNGSWVPQVLASSRQLGRYVDFLVREVDKHLSAEVPNVTKAAKRLFSLLTLMRRVNDVDQLADALELTQATELAAIEARESLRPRIEEIAQELDGCKLPALLDETLTRMKTRTSRPPPEPQVGPVWVPAREAGDLGAVVRAIFQEVSAILAA